VDVIDYEKSVSKVVVSLTVLTMFSCSAIKGSYTEEVGDRADTLADVSLCNGSEGDDALDIVSWPS
jgi:hypothetical protein